MDSDLRRQVIVTVSAVVCVFGTLVGLGVFGTRVAESSGGSLAADATLIAPATSAFSIWSVIYLGLGAYVVWQWLPAQKDDPRLRRTGLLASASMILNAAWLLVTQQGWLEVSVAVMVALVITLGVLVQWLHDDWAFGWGERIIVDGTFGLYLGWVSVALCANIAATLVHLGLPATGFAAELATVVVLAAVAGVSALISWRVPGQVAVGLGIVWGLIWVAVGRWSEGPLSEPVAVGAAIAAFLVALAFAFGLRDRLASRRR